MNLIDFIHLSIIDILLISTFPYNKDFILNKMIKDFILNQIIYIQKNEFAAFCYE